MRNHTLQRLGMLLVALLACSAVASPQWLKAPTPTAAQGGPFKPGTVALQLTDGSIMVQQNASPFWWKLTPDEHADYNNGTWSQLAPSILPGPLGSLVVYAPSDFASAVLPSGKVIVIGGEYLAGVAGQVLTTLGAIYDPVANTWKRVPPPQGWSTIGDSPSVVLPNGTFMLGQKLSNQVALLDEATLSWKIVTGPNGSGTGKYDWNEEEGWTLLPNGKVLAVDTYENAPDKGTPGGPGTRTNASEVFTPSPGTIADPVGTWTSAGNTVKPLSSLEYICPRTATGKYRTGAHETGPAVLRPDGTVFATGVYVCNASEGGGGGAGHTAIYDPNAGATGTWKAGPDIPCDFVISPSAPYQLEFVCNDMADAPAAVLPDGNVLVQTSPGVNNKPSTFYEFNLAISLFSPPIPPPPGFNQSSSEFGRMLVVASGHVFYMHTGQSDGMWLYVPTGTHNPIWEPIISGVTDDATCLVPGCITRGQTYTVSGLQLNGLTGGAAYGDENQSASNYPLVLIQNCASGHKYFARTFAFSTMAVATGFSVLVTANFTVAPNTELGPSSLIVIANGIPSQPFGAGCGRNGGYFTVYSATAN